MPAGAVTGIVTGLKAELQRLREQYAVGPEDDDYVVMRPNTVN